MTIKMDKRKSVIEEQESEEPINSEDELESDELEDEQEDSNESDSEEADSDNSCTEEIPTLIKTDPNNESSEEEEDESANGDNEDSDSEETPTKRARIERTNEDEEEDNDDDSDVNSDVGDEGGNANEAWADSIAKILKTNKPKKKKTLVLSKAKKLTDPVKEKTKSAGFEVATADGDVKEEKIVVKTEEKEESGKLPRKKKKDVLSFRVKPNILNKDRERLLSKIATKGVVQLFNAVKTQQKDISNKLESAGPLEVKRDKVLKNIDKKSFLDVLMGEKSTVVDEALSSSKETKTEDETKSSWNVLRDDFMMGAKMKDWDKELEGDDEEEEQEVEMESD